MSNRTPYTPDLDLLNEVWKPVVADRGIDFSELYLVSSLGRIRSLKFRGIDRDDIISGANCNGYVTDVLAISSGQDYKEQFFYRQRLVMLTHGPKQPSPKHVDVNHIDENKNNNDISNLEWSTRLQNCNYGSRNKRISEAVSIPVVQLDLDYNIIKKFKSSTEVYRDTGFSISNICAASKGIYHKECKHKGTHKAYQHF